MTCIISGKVVVAGSNGTVAGLANRQVYLRPSRTDFEFSFDGTDWQNWQGDLDLVTSWPGAIAALTDSNGQWSFVVPWTNSTSETRLPGGAPVPDLIWNIIDPNPATGVINYYGKTPQSIVGAAKTIKELITLAAPDTWQVGSVTYTAVPVGPRRFVSVPFTSSSTTAAIVMPDIGAANWRFGAGVESDDTSGNFYVPNVDTTSKTPTGGIIRLSDLPPAGKTVLVHIEAYL